MDPKHFSKAALLMLVITGIAVSSWELFLRKKGYTNSYDDGGPLWSDKRSQVYKPIDESTVFIGSSRIKFDLDIPTWKALTGDEPIQLAIQGNTPIPILENLGNDEKFRGRLIVDVTEPVFFRGMSAEAEKNLQFYKNNHTPAQKASFVLNRALESKFLFLDQDMFSLNATIDQMRIPSRPGVFVFPVFPFDFDRNTIDRQSYMADRFLEDTIQQNQVKEIWNFFRMNSRGAPPSGDTLTKIFASIKASADKIKARGGQVLFIRTPSSNPMLMGENMGFPRDKYWNPMLAYTRCPGIHFMDYPSIAGFTCPELSHLSPADAVVFTRHLVEILSADQHWKFPKITAGKTAAAKTVLSNNRSTF
jgi:hypothetical protein